MEDRTPSLEARAVLAPQPRASMLQFMSLLPLPAGDLESLVARAVEDNPALDRGVGWACATCGRFCRAARCESCSRTSHRIDLAATEDWRDSLRNQSRLEVPRDLLPVLDAVIDSLDDRGLLTELPPGVAADHSHVAAVLTTIRSVGPPGVGASSAVECVRLQAEALVSDGRADPILMEMVDGWLPATAERHWAEIATGLGVTQQRVRDAATTLTTLTRPYVSLAQAEGRSGPADVEFSLLDGRRLVASVVDAVGLGLRVADDFGDLDGEARAWLAPHRVAAERLVAAVNARARMLALTADVLAVRQRSFLVDARDHQPVLRAEVARHLGVHASTVGRAVADKVARCPDGRVIPMTSLFGAAPSTLDRVAAAISASPSATDGELAAALSHLGTPIARRTVAKYRALLRAVHPNQRSPQPR